jgi:hypothetical protein
LGVGVKGGWWCWCCCCCCCDCSHVPEATACTHTCTHRDPPPPGPPHTHTCMCVRTADLPAIDDRALVLLAGVDDGLELGGGEEALLHDGPHLGVQLVPDLGGRGAGQHWVGDGVGGRREVGGTEGCDEPVSQSVRRSVGQSVSQSVSLSVGQLIIHPPPPTIRPCTHRSSRRSCRGGACRS